MMIVARWDLYNLNHVCRHVFGRCDMRYPASETAQKHEKILDNSIRLFRERGFAKVSVSDIMKASGLTHGPFYNHFESKEALMAEALSRELQRALSDFDKFPATVAGKNAYADSYLSGDHLQNFGGGCAVAALCSEVRQEVAVRKSFTVQLKAVIQKISSRFPWKSRNSARGDAIHWYTSMVGALILARAIDDAAFADEILTETRKRLG